MITISQTQRCLLNLRGHLAKYQHVLATFFTAEAWKQKIEFKSLSVEHQEIHDLLTFGPSIILTLHYLLQLCWSHCYCLSICKDHWDANKCSWNATVPEGVSNQGKSCFKRQSFTFLSYGAVMSVCYYGHCYSAKSFVGCHKETFCSEEESVFILPLYVY